MLRQLGVHRLAFDVRVQGRAAVFAELKGKLLVVGDDFLDARLAQQGFDLADDIGVVVLGTELRPDDAVVDGLAVARPETDAVFF